MEIPNNIEKLRNYMGYKKYSEQSIKNYCSCLGKFLSSYSGKYSEPIKIPSSELIKYLGSFNEVNTHKANLSSLKLFYEKCLNQKCKFDKIEYPRSSKKLPIVLSQDEIQKMFTACENLKHKTIFALLYSAGLRVSEIINLKISHIDSSRMIINIIQAKGNKDRQVPLDASVLDLLRKYFSEYKPNEYLFNGQKELQYSERSVLEVMKQLAIKAGISKRVYTHLIRHCSFTHMVEAGTDINLIQKIAGHSNVKTTNIYLHISDSLISKIQSPISNIRL